MDKSHKLSKYQSKRNFSRTPEPKENTVIDSSVSYFVVHKHAARRLHYDLRLEHRGVLKSWAVTSEPTLTPGVRKLAILVEDHPYGYKDFEGVIPVGNYGAGPVMIWDNGNFTTLHASKKQEAEVEFAKGLEEGKVTFVLNGYKLKGEFSLIKLKEGEKNWLLIKKEDEFAYMEMLDKDISVVSGLTIEEIARKQKL